MFVRESKLCWLERVIAAKISLMQPAYKCMLLRAANLLACTCCLAFANLEASEFVKHWAGRHVHDPKESVTENSALVIRQ